MIDLVSMLWRGDPAEIVAAFSPDTIDQAVIEAIADSRPGWHADAACSGEDLALFFPSRGVTPRTAIAICARCAVREFCLDEALVDPALDHGVRGGLTVRQRQRLRMDRGRS